MNNNIDILGTMQKPKEGWQERVGVLCKPENFDAHARCHYNVSTKLSEDEYQRLYKKLVLVEEWALYMAVGMLKGVLKYETDAYPLDQWMSHMIGEGVDQSNYQMLLFDAWRKQNESRD